MGTLSRRIALRGRDAEAEAGSEATVDDALFAAAKADPAAFALLFRRYLDPIYRYCYRRLGERAAAEDAKSQVFERALQALPRYQGTAFRPWLFTIARNTVADVHRAPRREESLEPGAAAAIPDLGPGPEEAAATRDEARWVRGLLARLTPDQRQVVELRLAGLSDGEIAHTLGRSPGSVRTAQHRAVLRLRSVLGHTNEGDF